MFLVMAPLSSGGSSSSTCTVLKSSGMSRPLRDQRVTGIEDRLSLGVLRFRLEDDEIERSARPRLLVDVAYPSCQRERLADSDRSQILELLLAVHQGHEVEVELEEGVRATCQGLGHECDGIGERGRRRVGTLVRGVRVAQRSGEGGDVLGIDDRAAGGEGPSDHVSRGGHRSPLLASLGSLWSSDRPTTSYGQPAAELSRTRGRRSSRGRCAAATGLFSPLWTAPDQPVTLAWWARGDPEARRGGAAGP